jgi:6-pyruvoyltetrahydropterin/6-carboxytetrahydropterin synthase
MIIYKKYFFDAAHFMNNFKKNHKYSRLHGHSYEVIIKISGHIDKKNNWVFNYDDVDNLMNPLIKKLDHQTLNNIKGLENPTSENIAKWFWKNLKKKISKLESIEINRPRIGGCIYSGEELS